MINLLSVSIIKKLKLLLIKAYELNFLLKLGYS